MFTVGFRPETAADAPLVRLAHVEHRRAMFAAMPFPPDALMRLCEQQHDLQEAHIGAYHPDAERMMIEVRDRVVGRLCLDRTALPWRVVDIALVPEEQGRGTGGAAIARVLRDADAAGAAVELQVALDNPRAEALYRRFGFRDAITASATHRRLIRPPAQCIS